MRGSIPLLLHGLSSNGINIAGPVSPGSYRQFTPGRHKVSTSQDARLAGQRSGLGPVRQLSPAPTRRVLGLPPLRGRRSAAYRSLRPNGAARRRASTSANSSPNLGSSTQCAFGSFAADLTHPAAAFAVDARTTEQPEHGEDFPGCLEYRSERSPHADDRYTRR